MTICYYVRPGNVNEELRYSLRSLVNLPHERVVIVGHKPPWVTGVEHLLSTGTGSPQRNAVDHLSLACDRLDDERFTVFNDDFYVMEPTSIPSWHAGPLARARLSAPLRLALRALRALGYSDPLAWTLHIPLVVVRERLAAVLSTLGHPVPEWRTMYGNLTGQRGERADDVKVRRRSDPIPAGPFLSSSDATFSVVASLLRRAFPQPCEYES